MLTGLKHINYIKCFFLSKPSRCVVNTISKKKKKNNVHIMGSHIVSTMKAHDLLKLA